MRYGKATITLVALGVLALAAFALAQGPVGGPAAHRRGGGPGMHAMRGGGAGGPMGGPGAMAGPRGERPNPMAKFFEEADADGDGTITRDEYIAASEAAFDRIDTNGDGVLDEKEQPGPKSADVRAEMWIARADQNDDGQLSLDELGGNEQRMQRLDADGNGAVTHEEMTKAMEAMEAMRERRQGMRQGGGREGGPQALKGRQGTGGDFGARLIQRFDTNQDGKVTSEEFTGNADRFKQLDADGDGSLTQQEIAAQLETLRAQRRQGQGPKAQ